MVREPVWESLHEIVRRPAQRTADGRAFDPTASPLHSKAIFIVGAPRSGTTWLHQLLATHPAVATGGESHVFCEGVGSLLRNQETGPHTHLSTWLTRAELLSIVRRTVDDIFGVALRSRPGATRPLDKTPMHTPYAADLAAVYPDASFVHIIRDGRDAAGSARARWGAWDPRVRRWADSARAWQDAVIDVREHLRDLRYAEVRYEDLVEAPAAGLRSILEHLELEHDRASVDRMVDFGRAPINVAPSNASVGVRKWAGTDPRGEQTVISTVGELLRELGYVTPAEVVAARSARGSLTGAVRIVVDRLRPSAPSTTTALAADRRRRTERLVAAVTAGDESSIESVLGRGVTLSPELRTLFVTGTVVAIDADGAAAAVQLVDPASTRRMVRFVFDGESVVDVDVS